MYEVAQRSFLSEVSTLPLPVHLQHYSRIAFYHISVYSSRPRKPPHISTVALLAHSVFDCSSLLRYLRCAFVCFSREVDVLSCAVIIFIIAVFQSSPRPCRPATSFLKAVCIRPPAAPSKETSFSASNETPCWNAKIVANALRADSAFEMPE
jgi:hypothetical protein